MSEKFALKWNDFQFNWQSSLSKWRKEADFTDVTSISEDKEKFSAHKILLPSCSNIFKFILKENNQINPLLYLGGVSSVNIGFILDYIYYGEVNIFQEQLDSFLESAQKLEISGLIGDNQESHESEHQSFGQNQTPEQNKKQMKKEDQMAFSSDTSSSLATTNAQVQQKRQYSRTTTCDVPKIFVGNMTPVEIEAKTKEMYQKIDGVWTCLQCGKTSSGMSGNIRFHVETHMEGLCYTCTVCSMEFRSKNSLNTHKNTSHKLILGPKN